MKLCQESGFRRKVSLIGKRDLFVSVGMFLTMSQFDDEFKPKPHLLETAART